MDRKFKKLVRNPNRFFYDYFAKRLGKKSPDEKKIKRTTKSSSAGYILPAGYGFDNNIHPWIQIAKKFNLKTGVTTGYPDQSFLVSNHDHLQFIQYVSWLGSGFNVGVRFYTLGGALQEDLIGNELLNIKKIEGIFSKLHGKPDYVIEYLGGFENNFAAHIYIYDKVDDLITVRSSSAYIKKALISEFEKVYPDVINNFGGYEFGHPWPVDIVYTWVDKDEPSWAELWNSTFPEKPFDPDRFASKDELKYSLRALCKYLPWYHKVYVVSNCKKPDWLKENPKLQWVEHEEIFPDPSALPTFNSHAIEACLHNIEGLNERFIYFNDDMFVNRPCYYGDFFDHNGKSIAHLEPYGMISESNHFDQTKDYLAPSINCHHLIKKVNPEYNASRLHKHSPYALRKSVLEEIEGQFTNAFVETRKAVLRTSDDLNITSFLYHHYALAKGEAICSEFPYLIVRPSNVKSILDGKVRRYKFLCFNDGDGSSNDAGYIEKYYKIVDKLFPFKSSFEINFTSWSSVIISKTIMAYYKREKRIPEIRKSIGDAKVSLDTGAWGLWENSKRSWLSYERGSDYHTVIQDDAVVCNNFYDHLCSILSRQKMKDVICLYFRYKSKKAHSDLNETARSNRANKGFYYPRLQWGIANVVPTEMIDEMVGFADNLEDKKFEDVDDLRYSAYLSSIGKEIYYPLPSLVDQSAECNSTVGNGDNVGRQVTWFVDYVGDGELL